jgi:hypothetical protein
LPYQEIAIVPILFDPALARRKVGQASACHALSLPAHLPLTRIGRRRQKSPSRCEVDRSIPIRIDVTRRAGGEAEERAASRHCAARCRFWEMVCFSFCGLASEDELLAHKREVAVATSRFMNAAPVDVIDRLKPVLLSGVQGLGRTGLGRGNELSTLPDYITSPLHRLVRGNSLAAYRSE